MRQIMVCLISVCLMGSLAQSSHTQTAPDDAVVAAYRGLHAAVAAGKLGTVKRLAAGGADLNATDGHGRTPLMIAGYRQ